MSTCSTSTAAPSSRYEANAADGTAVLTGTRVLVSPDAAAALDKVFSTTAVTPGLLVGVATITINTK